MSIGVLRVFLLGLVCECALASNATAADPEGDDVHLAIYAASPVDATADCLVGDMRNVDTLESDALVGVWDSKRGERFKVLLPSAGLQNSRAIACSVSSNAFYVLSEHETDSRPESSETRVKLHQLGRDGTLLKSIELDVGVDRWTYLLQATADGVVTVSGGARLGGKKSSNFVITFDASLKEISRTNIAHGSYDRGSSAQLKDGRLLVAGRFLDDGADDNTPPRYAASLIDAQSGRYLWSKNLAPELAGATDVQVAVDSTYGVGLVAKRVQSSYLLFLDASGKKTFEREAARTDCAFQNAVLTRSLQIYVASWDCSPDRSSAILSANREGLTIYKRLSAKGSALLTRHEWINVFDDPSVLKVETGPVD